MYPSITTTDRAALMCSGSPKQSPIRIRFKLAVRENPQCDPSELNSLVSHLIFLDEGEDSSLEEMSLNNRAGMLIRLPQMATCVIV